MSNIQERAVNKSGQENVPIEENQAVSVLLPFALVKQLLQGYPAPRRPNRTRPLPCNSMELRDEFNAWEAASDEAFESMEDSLPE